MSNFNKELEAIIIDSRNPYLSSIDIMKKIKALISKYAPKEEKYDRFNNNYEHMIGFNFYRSELFKELDIK